MRQVIRLAAAASVVWLSGCNTFRGLTYDVEAIADSADAFVDDLTKDRPAHHRY